MHRRTAFFLLSAWMMSVLASDPAVVGTARLAATTWLGQLDASDAASTWEQSASGFKRAVTSQQWAQTLTSVRAPLGSVRQRQEVRAQFSKSLPGAPDGEYVLFQFQTSFENKTSAVETVTVVRDTDGLWRVTGYFIK